MAQAALTERWKSNEEKTPENQFFFLVKKYKLSYIEVGQKQKTEKKRENTPGTRGGPDDNDRTLAVPKNRAKPVYFSRKKIKIT